MAYTHISMYHIVGLWIQGEAYLLTEVSDEGVLYIPENIYIYIPLSLSLSLSLLHIYIHF